MSRRCKLRILPLYETGIVGCARLELASALRESVVLPLDEHPVSGHGES